MTTFDDNQLTFFDNQLPQTADEFASGPCDLPQPEPAPSISTADHTVEAAKIETPASTRGIMWLQQGHYRSRFREERVSYLFQSRPRTSRESQPGRYLNFTSPRLLLDPYEAIALLISTAKNYYRRCIKCTTQEDFSVGMMKINQNPRYTQQIRPLLNTIESLVSQHKGHQ